jgi:cyclophilin family peptidyl-prolyl cis-trans isomerase
MNLMTAGRRLARAWMTLAILFAALTFAAPAQATLVRFDTAYGPIDIDLLDTTAPRTVTNFLNYTLRGAYNNTFFHRHAANFVLQGGGYSWALNSATCCTAVTKDPAIQNEYSATRPNVRGSVAMAKLGGQPNSATNEWFINLIDNTTTLGPTNNSGFSVFGRVTTPSMAVIDSITRLPVVNAGSPFDTLPITALPANAQPLTRASLVTLTGSRVLPTTTASDSDRVFNYLEAAYPQFVKPASAPSATGSGYYFRYYAATNSYVGTKDGLVYYLVPEMSNEITLLGPLADWLAVAQAQGY